MVILLVSEEDGSATYYRLSSCHTEMLSKINNNNFQFFYNKIICENKLLNIDDEMYIFLQKFRHGKNTFKWGEIAKKICTIEITEPTAVCLSYDYSIFLHH